MRTTRRDLIKYGAGLGALAAVPAFLRGVARAEEEGGRDDRVLVVLQLSGGNDGLATVVPYADEALYRVRRATAVKPEEVIRIEEDLGLGLHPALAKLQGVYEAGRMAIVPGAGYPEPNRSHFASMDIWHTADHGGRRNATGWLGRAVDHEREQAADPETAINIGASLPYALEADVQQAISFQNAQAYRWIGRQSELAAFEALNARTAGEGVTGRLHRTAEDALRSSARIRRAAAAYRPKAEYPRRGGLPRDLALTTALITADLPVRVVYLQTGGFDTHTGQRGRHDNLMRNLGESIAAFLEDLEAHGVADRVVLMAFSEFGRCVRENA
ncbi:MAG: DUF1501 domain-containing protein, partial [Planctomycetota bacterium]